MFCAYCTVFVIDKMHTASYFRKISHTKFSCLFIYQCVNSLGPVLHTPISTSDITFYNSLWLICSFKHICRLNWLDRVVCGNSVLHVWRTGLLSMSRSVVNVCLNSLLYHRRNVRRLKKCSKANEVLSLQRILPSEPKRKMKLLDQAQLSRITGLWKLWVTRHLGRMNIDPELAVKRYISMLNFSSVSQGSWLKAFLSCISLCILIRYWRYYTLDCGNWLKGCRGNLQQVHFVWTPNLLLLSGLLQEQDFRLRRKWDRLLQMLKP